MHRQSLGSPASKLHINGVIIKETSSPSSSSSELLQKELPNDDYEDEKSQKKSHKITPSSKHPEKFIHLIPILTLLCILVLYIFSHDPSQNDLAQFNGFKSFSKPIDSTNMDEIQRVMEIRKGDILAIGNLRSLHGLDKENPRNRINRKFGDF